MKNWERYLYSFFFFFTSSIIQVCNTMKKKLYALVALRQNKILRVYYFFCYKKKYLFNRDLSLLSL